MAPLCHACSDYRPPYKRFCWACILGHGFATAGALTASFNLGSEFGSVGNRYGFAYGRKRPWWPNLDRDIAPGA